MYCIVSKILLCQRWVCLTHSFGEWGWTSKCRIAKFGLTKLETSLCRMDQSRYLEPFRRESGVLRTDRRRDILIADVSRRNAARSEIMLDNFNCIECIVRFHATAVIINAITLTLTKFSAICWCRSLSWIHRVHCAAADSTRGFYHCHHLLVQVSQLNEFVCFE